MNLHQNYLLIHRIWFDINTMFDFTGCGHTNYRLSLNKLHQNNGIKISQIQVHVHNCSMSIHLYSLNKNDYKQVVFQFRLYPVGRVSQWAWSWQFELFSLVQYGHVHQVQGTQPLSGPVATGLWEYLVTEPALCLQPSSPSGEMATSSVRLIQGAIFSST